MTLRNGQMAVFVEEKLDERDTFKVIRLSVTEASQRLRNMLVECIRKFALLLQQILKEIGKKET